MGNDWRQDILNEQDFMKAAQAQCDAEQIIAEIVDIRVALIRGDYQSEAAISDGVVRRLIEGLGWPRYDTQVVFPQFPIEKGKVDFALCHPRGKPVVLLEVKNVGVADEKGERQLFEYCFHRGVPIAVLTDGRTWKLFHPTGEGSYTDRLFCGVDLIDGDAAEIANNLIRYLAHSAVKSGRSQQARSGGLQGGAAEAPSGYEMFFCVE